MTHTIPSQLNGCQQLVYTPYGYCSPCSGVLGFNGEQSDSITGYYILGNGYRAFNPLLMRFNSPDSMSPLGSGGLSSYGYCQQDPVNYQDPSGHSRFGRFVSGLYSRITGASRPAKEVFPAVHANVTPLLEGLIRPFGKKNGLGKVRQPPPVAESNVKMNVVTGRTETAGYELLGCHGSSEMHKSSLERGVKLERNFVSENGPGFYYTQNLEYAMFYAGDRGRDNGQGYVYGVYGKKPALKGHDQIPPDHAY